MQPGVVVRVLLLIEPTLHTYSSFDFYMRGTKRSLLNVLNNFADPALCFMNTIFSVFYVCLEIHVWQARFIDFKFLFIWNVWCQRNLSYLLKTLVSVVSFNMFYSRIFHSSCISQHSIHNFTFTYLVYILLNNVNTLLLLQELNRYCIVEYHVFSGLVNVPDVDVIAGLLFTFS